MFIIDIFQETGTGRQINLPTLQLMITGINYQNVWLVLSLCHQLPSIIVFFILFYINSRENYGTRYEILKKIDEKGWPMLIGESSKHLSQFNNKREPNYVFVCRQDSG
jgi:hypothetical protein